MSESKKYYCFCGSNCKYETMTKEQILTAITQAITEGSIGDIDSGFITRVKEHNGGKSVTFWVGTRVQYNALESIDPYCIYIITDDTTKEDLLRTVEQMAADCAAAAESAGEAAAAAKKRDIANAISFTLDTAKSPATITSHTLTLRHAVYSAGAGVVFFDVLLQFNGTLAAGDTIVLKMAGSYPPAGQVAIPCVSPMKRGHFSAYMNADGTLGITAHENMDIGTNICLSGWYFCEGK